MLIFLSRTGTASHSDIFDRAAESGCLMSFEMGQTDENIRVHHCTSDFRFFDILAALHRNFNIIGSFQTVADQDRTPNRHRGKSVFPCTIQVFQRIFPASRIQRITIRQKRLSAKFFHNVRHRFRIIRTQEAQIAKLPEMHLDRHEFILHVDL